ncbi:membrane protein [Pseudoxanthomonas suwonensis]|uniref:Membrane protein n=1 Tax=Pseudoxanthomonas suwonensis TaxID=314722 RepID=A0A0E3Z5M8_9GAMM|nr:membrane protein [Pseudoxanthomonas suwonensis]
MERWLGLLLVLLALPSMAALAGSRDDYARQWPLVLGQDESGAYRVELGEAVYRSASQAALGDIEVFNADGQPLPAALLSPAQPLAQPPRTLALPWFPLPAVDPAAGGGDLRLVAERDQDGGIVRIEAGIEPRDGAVAAPGQWLVDASRLREPVRALLLEWERPQQSLQVRYRVEGSNDLRRWRTLNEGTTLLDLERGGERLVQGRIVLDGQARYLRLLPLRPGLVPALTGVIAELAPPPPDARWEWVEIAGQRRSEGGRDYFEYVLPGRFPVERADVRLPGNSAVQWTLHSREDARGSWLWRAGPWMAFQVGGSGDGGADHSEPKPLASMVRDRHWRLSAGSPVGDVVPVLRLGYRPEVVVFLAQGSPPFALAAGSANASRAEAPIPALLEALRRQRGAGWQPAPAYLADAVEELAGERALQPQRQVDWKSLLLWGLLIGGAVLVAALGLSLLRQRPSAD